MSIIIPEWKPEKTGNNTSLEKIFEARHINEITYRTR